MEKGLVMGDISKIRDMHDCNVLEEKIKEKLKFLNHKRYADKFEDYFNYIKGRIEMRQLARYMISLI
jgi:hypothetical protein